MQRIKRTRGGFSLIELLLVVSIIGLFVSIGVTTAQTGQQRARDTERKETMKKLQVYLELYRDNNGTYPSTGGQWFSSSPNDDDFENNAGNWIPDLAPGYIPTLPKDPLGGRSKNANPACTVKQDRSYIYFSDGLGYVLLSYCAPERPWTSTDPFYDPLRPTWAFKVCSPTYCSALSSAEE